jgi:hypothetical protein
VNSNEKLLEFRLQPVFAAGLPWSEKGGGNSEKFDSLKKVGSLSVLFDGRRVKEA